MNKYAELRSLSSFGDVAAEQDPVIQYFLSTDAVSKIRDGFEYLVLGRKGSGKTALVRHFAESDNSALSRAVNLSHYPWNVHATRIDRGSAEIEAYVASWYYLIAIELGNLLLAQAGRGLTLPPAVALHKFLADNYGKQNVSLDEILRPSRLMLSNLSFEPEILGCKLGSIGLQRGRNDTSFGLELRALTKLILEACVSICEFNKISKILIHFDELDRGLSEIDGPRSSMLIGLILAADAITRDLGSSPIRIKPVVYLRSDIWDDLRFSDKNKIAQSRAINLEWDELSLKELVNLRVQVLLGNHESWDTITTARLMRGSQSKWNHLVARTFRRPRDVISFMNAILEEIKKRSAAPDQIDNEDIVKARTRYSRYLKQELDDEIGPHWSDWEVALQACSMISTITFSKDQFRDAYAGRIGKSPVVSAEEALERLYRFSVLGYEKRSGYGGSAWVFDYIEPEAGWDSSALRFKIHLGLKEFAKLREDRQVNWDLEVIDLDHVHESGR